MLYVEALMPSLVQPGQNPARTRACSGGKISVTLVNGTNIPDRDKFKAGSLSDPYVELSVGGTIVR